MSRSRSFPPLDPEDLSARVRRGSASEAERAALEQALASNRTLAVTHQVGLDFDRAFSVRAGDEKLISALADAALGSPPRRALIAQRRRWLLLGLAAALAIASTAAAWNALIAPRRSAKPTTISSVNQQSAATAPPAGGTGELAAAPTASSLQASPLVLKAGGTSKALVPAMSSAAALFSEAAAARHVSDFGRARSLYRQLEREYPSSSEAHLACVSLGKVLLAMGRTQEAEQQFALYLGTGGSLTEEALVGRAQSLQRQGQQTDERHVWQTLLADFPSSVYAPAARDRLRALGRERADGG